MKIFFVSALLAVLVIAFSFGEALPYEPNKVVLNLTFDEGGSDVAKDSSPFGNDGVLQYPQWEEGKFGKALKFNGVDDYVAIPHSESLDITDSITMAAWVKLSTTRGQDETSYIDGIGYIITKGQLFQNGTYRLYANTDGTFGMNIKIFQRFGQNIEAKPDFGNSFDGKWHHVAGTFDGTYLRLYIDGEEKAGREIITGPGGNRKIISADYDVAVGGWGDRTHRMVEGVIDEVRIYNAALTREEILTEMFGDRVMVESKMVNPCAEFTVDVSAHLKENSLHSFTFDLMFDPEILQAVSVEEGPFLSRDGGDATLWEKPQVDNEKGVITNVQCRGTEESDAAKNTVVLATVTFKAIKAGSGAVSLQNLRLSGRNKEEITAHTQVGSVDVFPHGRISGVVIDALNRKPIPGARIEAANRWLRLRTFSYSDENGKYTLDSVPIGYFDVSATKSEYLTETFDAHVKSGEMTDNVNLKMKLKRDLMYLAVAMEREVINPYQQFTVDISAFLEYYPIHRFAFDLQFDPAVLQAVSVKEGPFLSRGGADATSFPTPTIDNKNGVITGIRCSRAGEAGVAEKGSLATMTFEASDMGSTDLSIQNLRLFLPWGEEMEVSVKEGSVDVYPHGSISGVVSDSVDNLPIPGAKVEIYKGNFTSGSSAYSANDGTYTIDGVPPGDFEVIASIDGYIPEIILEVRVEQGKNTADVDIKLTSFKTASNVPIMTPIAVGESAVDFVLQDIDGNQIIPSDFAGKPIILNFWDSASEHCQRQIPHLDALYKEYESDGLVMIGVSKEIVKDDVLEFARSQMSYTAILNGTEAFQAYGVTSIPCMYCIDKTGEVRYRDVGFPSGGEAKMEQRISGLMEHK